MNPLFLILSIDTQKESCVEWRNTLMSLFFHDISPPGKHMLSNKLGIEHVCGTAGWAGISCQMDAVTTVVYYMFQFGNFRLNCLPHSTDTISIQHCDQTFLMDTRGLPKSLVFLCLRYNMIGGRLDLTLLPQRLEEADFMFNHLIGPISFTKLPKTLSKLDVSRNRIKQATVWYDDLPENITIFLMHSEEKKRIGEVRSVHPEAAIHHKDVFRGMEPVHVH